MLLQLGLVVAAGLRVDDAEVVVGEATLRPGDTITIDGTTGEIFAGAAAGTAVVVPEAATLLA